MSLRQQHEALAVSNPVNELAYLHCVTRFKVSAIPRQQTTGKARFKSRQCCLTMLTRGKQKKRLNNALGQSRKEGKDEKREDRFRGERRASGDTKILRCAQDDRRGKSIQLSCSFEPCLRMRFVFEFATNIF